ncbi:MAG: A/G-specific adenine glycosylase, partial [uncultured Acidimicrobiales bacterium]
ATGADPAGRAADLGRVGASGPALAPDPGPVGRPRQRAHVAADPGPEGRAALAGVPGRVPDTGSVRRGPGRRRAASLAGPRLQPACREPPPGGDGRGRTPRRPTPRGPRWPARAAGGRALHRSRRAGLRSRARPGSRRHQRRALRGPRPGRAGRPPPGGPGARRRRRPRRSRLGVGPSRVRPRRSGLRPTDAPVRLVPDHDQLRLGARRLAGARPRHRLRRHQWRAGGLRRLGPPGSRPARRRAAERPRAARAAVLGCGLRLARRARAGGAGRPGARGRRPGGRGGWRAPPAV